MRQFNVWFDQGWKIVLIILLPGFGVAPLILVCVYFSKYVTPEMVGGLMAVYLALCMWFVLRMVKRIQADAMLTFKADGFAIDFSDKSFFIPDSFEVKTKDIENYYLEGNSKGYFLNFKTFSSPGSFNIASKSNSEEDRIAFAEIVDTIAGMVEEHNRLHTDITQPISSVTMYERWWAKILSVFVIVVAVAMFFANFFLPEGREVEWWRFFPLIIFGVPFIYKVYFYNFKKRK